MDLLIGGRAQGKLALALQRHPDISVLDENASLTKLKNQKQECWIWNHFHLFVKARLAEGMDVQNLREFVLGILEECPNVIIISDEIGNGIVPMVKEERLWREETGRLLCKIAEHAENVERVICGIPVKIKE